MSCLKIIAISNSRLTADFDDRENAEMRRVVGVDSLQLHANLEFILRGGIRDLEHLVWHTFAFGMLQILKPRKFVFIQNPWILQQTFFCPICNTRKSFTSKWCSLPSNLNHRQQSHPAVQPWLSPIWICSFRHDPGTFRLGLRPPQAFVFFSPCDWKQNLF